MQRTTNTNTLVNMVLSENMCSCAGRHTNVLIHESLLKLDLKQELNSKFCCKIDKTTRETDDRSMLIIIFERFKCNKDSCKDGVRIGHNIL